MLRLSSNKFYAADDVPGSGTRDLNAPAPETYDLLDTSEETEVIPLEDEKIPAKAKGDREKDKEPDKGGDKTAERDAEDSGSEPEEGEEIDELAELEKELEEPDEEKLELITPVRRREILAKYPKLFKDFPYLEKAYYRDQQFTEIYPTIEDARNANEKAETFDRFGQQLMEGNQEEILKSLKQEDQESFHKVVDNYMLALWNTDQVAYHHVVGNINKTLIASMVQEGKKLQNDQLIQAAAILNQFVFGTAEWTQPTRLSKDTRDPRHDELQQREQEFNQKQFNTARVDLQTRVSNSIMATIEQNIDPTSAMTDYIKRAACADAMKNLERLIDMDKGFQSLKDKLWIRAAEEGFSRPAMDRLRSAFATKAKTLLPTVLKKARNDALKGFGRRSREVEDTEDVNDGTTRPSKDRKTTSSPRSSGNTYKDKAQKIPQGMSTLEFFNSD